MAQLSLYLNDSSMMTLRRNAKSAGKSLSCFVADLLDGQRQQTNCYPDSFWATFGALNDPTFKRPESLDASLDEPLPSFD